MLPLEVIKLPEIVGPKKQERKKMRQKRTRKMPKKGLNTLLDI